VGFPKRHVLSIKGGGAAGAISYPLRAPIVETPPFSTRSPALLLRGSNARLNRVFELNHLPYDGYPGDDDAGVVNRQGKRAAASVDEGPSRGAAPAATTKKRKLGTAAEGLGVSNCFAGDLLGTCVAPGGRMSSPELRESLARMLEVTGGRWLRNVLIPRAVGEDMFTSRLARELKVFPYRRNIAAVVSAVMDKDRQDATQKLRAFTRVEDPSREAKKARGLAKSAAPGSSKPPPVVKPAAPGPSKPLSGVQLAAPGSGKLTPAEAMEERRPPAPPRTTEADVSMNVCVDDYLVGGVMMFDARTGRGLVGEFFWSGSLTR
jgi:hypothetical protein